MIIESRDLFSTGDLRIVGRMEEDDTTPDEYGKGSAYDDDLTIESWRRDHWAFRYMVVAILWNDVEIASDGCGGIEHGAMLYRNENGAGASVACNAWELTPAQYPDAQSVIGGSPLNNVVMEALSSARIFAGTVGPGGALVDALTVADVWANPNARKEVRA